MRYCISLPNWSKISTHAGVAELADAYASGAYEGSLVKVQVLSPAPSEPTHKIVRKLSNYWSQYKIKMLGEALAWEYIRNVGIDACKPDTH